jgi:hypothetical protein
MNMWVWVVIGAAAEIGLSLLVGLVLGRILRSIGQAASRLLDDELLVSAPLTRAIVVANHSWRRTDREALGSRTTH